MAVRAMRPCSFGDLTVASDYEGPVRLSVGYSTLSLLVLVDIG